VSEARDVQAFDRRAARYDAGWLGEWHRELVRRVAEIVRTLDVAPSAVLDVGCGTGRLLTVLAQMLPTSAELVGIDPAPGMVNAAIAASRPTARIRFEQAAAESLPFADDAFDLILSTVAFDHWADQQAGLCECARVLHPTGTLLLVDLLAPWLWLTTLRRRRRARTPRQLAHLLHEATLRPVEWRPVMDLGPLSLIQAVIAKSSALSS